METYWYLWEVVINIVTDIAIGYLLFRQLGVDTSKKKFMIVGVFTIAAIISLINLFDVNFAQTIASGFTIYWNRIIISILFFIFAVLVYNGNISEKIMWSSIPMFIISLADFISLSIASIVYRTDIYAVTQYGESRFLVTIIHILVIIAMCLLLAKINWKKGKSRIFIPPGIRYLLVAVVLLGTATIDVLLDNFYVWQDGEAVLNIGELSIGITFLFIIFSMFFLVMKVGVLTNENMEIALKNQQRKLEKDSFQQMAINVQEIREIKHNIIHHIEVIQGLAAGKKHQELEQYCETLTGNYIEKTSTIFLDNPILNSLLYSKTIHMRKENIAFHPSLYDLDRTSLDQFDLCSILGNLLDNAIEACLRLPESESRYISLHAKTHEQLLIIQLENSCDGRYRKNADGNLKTRKTGKGHGLGIKHIQRIVQSYGGHILIQPQSSKFQVSVFLPYRKWIGEEDQS